MNTIKQVENVSFPDADTQENFEFEALCESGTFTFHFKWINESWSVWVTLPDGTVRQAGVYSNVINWTGNSDYGLVFVTELETIDFNSLFSTSLYLITWQ